MNRWQTERGRPRPQHFRIALADLLPELQETAQPQKAALELVFVFLGIGIMFLLLAFD